MISRALLLTLLFTSLVHAQAPWNPLEKQSVEFDTLYLLDADAEMKLEPGKGGLIPGDASNVEPWTRVVATPGKFRTGLKCVKREYGYVWMPSIGLISPDEFTIEMWLKCEKPWAEVKGQTPFRIFDEHQTFALELAMNDGGIRVTLMHPQDPKGPVRADITRDLKKFPLAAQTWVNFAITFREGTLSLFIDGKLIGTKEKIPQPRIIGDGSRGDGLSLLGAAGRGADEFSMSDLRISRFARTPGQAPDLSRAANVLTIQSDKPTGDQIRPLLLGGLHTLRGPKTEEMAKGAFNVIRTDKLLTVTPMKKGGVDAEHPSAGISGKFAYDWQVVDRTFDYFKRIGVMPYISIDSTPSILGGKAKPFTGEKLATSRSNSSNFTHEIPDDFAAFGDIVRDLVHHVIVERKEHVPYWGVWNEPDGPSFWNQKLDDYLRLYEVCAAAVKAVDPKLKIGGPETASFDRAWIEGLIKHCGEKKLPLDFVSWHYYAGSIATIPQARIDIDRWCKQYGVARPELIVGEWCWNPHNFPKTGYKPWRNLNYLINDWHATFTAASLMEMQHAGVVVSIYTNPVAEADAAGFAASGLMSQENPWANLNVFRMWSKLAPQELQTIYTGRPGVFAIASRDPASGKLTVLIAYLRYRKEAVADAEIAIRIPGVKENAKVTHYLVDDAHSNAFDGGKEHADLETIEAPAIKAETMSLHLRPRSVHLLTIE